MGNIADDLSFAGRNRERFKDGLTGFYAKMPFTHALTLCWNADVRPQPTSSKMSVERARQDIGALLARVDRKLLGTRFHKKRDRRTTGVFFFEHADRNLHAHGLIRVQPNRLLDFHRLFPNERGGLWNDLVPAGSYRLEIIDDVRTTVGYVLKEQHLATDERMTVWAEDFFA
jgi:hypothetical protein